MLHHIQELYRLAFQTKRTIIGLMSGTSLDGLDIALCDVRDSGYHTRIDLRAFATVPYDEDFKKYIYSIFAKKEGSLEMLCTLNPWIALQHAQMILQQLDHWGMSPMEVDLIASHGQTIHHSPKSQRSADPFPNATLQLGDGDHLAYHTGIITIADFRQKHIAAGGEGAPLALYGDYLLFGDPSEHRILLNMGGIANLTNIPPSVDLCDVDCLDVGPGNTLMDAYMREHLGLPFDQDAQLALQGTLIPELLNELWDHPYFQYIGAKTTGPEVFHLTYLREAISRLHPTTGSSLTHENIMHTLAHFTANSIATWIDKNTNSQSIQCYASGGGASNPLLMKLLKQYLPPSVSLRSTEDLGIDPDAKEAILFALLANETVCGEVLEAPSDRNPWVGMGKICLPH